MRIVIKAVATCCILLAIQALCTDAGGIIDVLAEWRPPFQFMSSTSEHKELKLKKGRFDTKQEVADFTRRALGRVSSEIQTTFEELLTSSNEFQDSGPEPGPSDHCTSDPARLDQALSHLANLDEILANDNDTCPLCIDLFEILQQLACEADYDKLVRAIIVVCEVIFEQTGVSNPIMCNGTITMQAPFLVITLRESTPYDYCDTLNMCFPPPKQNQLSVPERVSRMLFHAKSNTAPQSQTVTKQQNGEIKILQLADIHMSTVYATGSATDCGMYVCCLDEFPGNGSARMYGEYQCNIPERTMHHILDAAKDLEPHFIIYSGDSPPHTMWDETRISQLNCSRIVIKALRDRFPDTRIFPSIGNHEMFPTNIYTMDARYNDTALMNAEFAGMWRDLAEFGSEQESTMKELAYYSMLIPGYDKLRLLSINTNHYWYSLNFMAPLNRNTTEEAKHRQFIKDTLNASRTDGEKVIVVGHHPTSMLDSTVRATRWWEEVVMEYSDIIIMMISGHTHNDEFHLFLDPNTDSAKAVNYVAPAFTSNTNINPSIRMFYLDAVTFEVLNFESYFADLDTQKPDVPPEVKKNYDAKSLYGLSDLTPESWKQLSIRFVENDEDFQFWYKNKNAQATDKQCIDNCRPFEICSMWFPNYDEVDACVANWDDSYFTGAALRMETTFSLILLGIVLSFLSNIL